MSDIMYRKQGHIVRTVTEASQQLFSHDEFIKNKAEKYLTLKVRQPALQVFPNKLLRESWGAKGKERKCLPCLHISFN